jgi:hypothetical protein
MRMSRYEDDERRSHPARSDQARVDARKLVSTHQFRMSEGKIVFKKQRCRRLITGRWSA